MGKKRSLLNALCGSTGYSDKEKAMLRAIDDYGASVNARLHKINREVVSDIDHMGDSYPPSGAKRLNGTTSGIEITRVSGDNFCQVLNVSFGPMAYAPSHRHPHYCVCHVLTGEIYDSVRGKRYDQGEVFVIDPGVVHSAQSIGGAVVRMYCTHAEMVAESILRNKKYLPNDVKVPVNKLKIKEV